jgi:hypothetical protein
MQKSSFFATTLLFFLSCTEKKQTETPTQPKVENPVALQEHSLDVGFSKRKSSDLVDEIYKELAQKNETLKQLEQDLDAYHDASNTEKLKEKFNNYNSKSENYYRAADSNLSSLSDSVLRKRIAFLLKQSESQNASKNEVIEGFLGTINKQNLSIEDYHSVLKIVKTLPVIEKYQKDNMVDEKDFKQHIQEQENLIQKIQKLIDK